MPRTKTMGRAANGVGSIRKKSVQKNGKTYTYYEARATVGFDPGTGKQIQKSITGKTQKEVAQKLRQITTALDDGTYKAPSKLTVGEWLDIWTRDYLGGVKASTAYLYKKNVELLYCAASWENPAGNFERPYGTALFIMSLLRRQTAKQIRCQPKRSRTFTGFFTRLCSKRY